MESSPSIWSRRSKKWAWCYLQEVPRFMTVIPPLASSWKMLHAATSNVTFRCRAQVYLAAALKACLTGQCCTRCFCLHKCSQLCAWGEFRYFLDLGNVGSGPLVTSTVSSLNCLSRRVCVFIKEILNSFFIMQFFSSLQYCSCKNLIGNVQLEVNDGFSKQSMWELQLPGPVEEKN